MVVDQFPIELNLIKHFEKSHMQFVNLAFDKKIYLINYDTKYAFIVAVIFNLKFLAVQ